MIDMNALENSIGHIAKQLAALSIEIEKCKRGEYSPLMSWDRFQQKFEASIAEMGAKAGHVCLCGGLGVGPHRCNQREHLVQAFMARESKVPA
jgi:hypothetical protein